MRAGSAVIPAPTHVIPAKAGIYCLMEVRLGILATTHLWFFAATLITRPICKLVHICRAHLYVVMCPLPIICRRNRATVRPMQFHVPTSPGPPRVEYIPIWVKPNPPFVSTVIIFEYLHRKPPLTLRHVNLPCCDV